jgi:hypothetical protein
MNGDDVRHERAAAVVMRTDAILVIAARYMKIATFPPRRHPGPI